MLFYPSEYLLLFRALRNELSFFLTCYIMYYFRIDVFYRLLIVLSVLYVLYALFAFLYGVLRSAIPVTANLYFNILLQAADYTTAPVLPKLDIGHFVHSLRKGNYRVLSNCCSIFSL